MSRFPSSDAVLERMQRLHPKVIDLTLDRVWRLLGRLDHPEKRLPPVIHVAGTNGKGSVAAMLAAVSLAVAALTAVGFLTDRIGKGFGPPLAGQDEVTHGGQSITAEWPAPANPRHPVSPLPLLPSGPGGVYG